jgi:hypothetical protein
MCRAAEEEFTMATTRLKRSKSASALRAVSRLKEYKHSFAFESLVHDFSI